MLSAPPETASRIPDSGLQPVCSNPDFNWEQKAFNGRHSTHSGVRMSFLRDRLKVFRALIA